LTLIGTRFTTRLPNNPTSERTITFRSSVDALAQSNADTDKPTSNSSSVAAGPLSEIKARERHDMLPS
jgi:hypothetical protein